MAVDECPGARARRHVALAQQAVVGDAHCRPRHAGPLRQLAARRQSVAFAQAAIEDQPPQLTVDLACQVVAPDEADMEVHPDDRTPWTWSGPVGRNWLSHWATGVRIVATAVPQPS